MRYLESSAEFSPCGLYRYRLLRRMGMGKRIVLFVGTNPSTADSVLDDPTIRRCVGYAMSWGFDYYLMGNLHGYRSTDPKVLLSVPDPVGPGNEEALQRMARQAELIVAAWGSAYLTPAAATLGSWLLSLPHTRCLGTNKDGRPKHPLYLRRDAALVRCA